MGRFKKRILYDTNELKIYDEQFDKNITIDELIDRANILNNHKDGMLSQSEMIKELKVEIQELEASLKEKENNRLNSIPTESLIKEIYNRMADNVEKGNKYDKLLEQHKKAGKLIAELKNQICD